MIKNTVLGISDAHIWVFESPLPQELCEHLWFQKHKLGLAFCSELSPPLPASEAPQGAKKLLKALSYHSVGLIATMFLPLPQGFPIFAWVPAACMAG